jgi:hypothetical protein
MTFARTRGATMSRAFLNKPSILWLAGVFVLIVGFIAAAVILPTTAKTPGSDQPSIQVPRMENVPPPEAPRMRLDTGKSSE